MEAMKNDVWAVRSSTPIRIAASSIGGASSIRIEVANTDQTKIGIRIQVIPGARIVMIVTSRLNPSSTIEIPTSAKKPRYAS